MQTLKCEMKFSSNIKTEQSNSTTALLIPSVASAVCSAVPGGEERKEKGEERKSWARVRARNKMEDYAREMMELKTLVTRTLEKKGVLARIRAELRASVFEAIEEEDRVAENNSNLPSALVGSCNDRAKQLHISPSGRLLTALICEYLDWAQLGHTLKVYLPECNLPRDFWKEELKDFSSSNKNGESGPLLLDVLEGYLKYENLMQNRLASGSLINSDSESVSSAEVRNVRRSSALSSSSAVPGGLPSLDRPIPRVHSSDRRPGSSVPSIRKDDYMWRYDAEVSDDVIQAANALENIHLDRKARNMTTTWRQANDSIIEDIGMMDRQ